VGPGPGPGPGRGEWTLKAVILKNNNDLNTSGNIPGVMDECK
jgi:hypothetical protein